ncbi:MAG: aryl-sulfate sulfotransferase [Myxococcota bacterium]|nr:aryl-sulfate sulfotransferase [Myxococcota bacterium]
MSRSKHFLTVFLVCPLLLGCQADSGLVETDAAVTPDVSPALDAVDPASPEPLILSVESQVGANSVLVAVVSVMTARPASVQVAFSSALTPERRTRSSAIGTEHQVLVVGLREATPYTLVVTATPEDGGEEASWEPLTHTTGAIPHPVPEFQVETFSPEALAPGITLLGVNKAGGAVLDEMPLYWGVDRDGEVVWYWQDETAQHDHTDRDLKALEDGTLLLALKTQYRHVDPAGEVLVELAGGNYHHDMIFLPSGTYLGLLPQKATMVVESLGGEVSVKGDRLREFTVEGETVWQWSAFDWIDTERFPSALSQEPSKKDGSHDWTHANGLFYVEEDDSLLLSMRHQNQVAKIDHKTGEVVWLLGEGGDFQLVGDGEWFYSQHAPEWDPETLELTLYDNGNDRPGEPRERSRAVIYQMDEEARTVEQVWSWETESFTGFLGDADRLPNGNVLVCAGGNRLEGQGPSIPGPARITEVKGDNTGEKLWELTVEGFVYRAIRVDWHSQ